MGDQLLAARRTVGPVRTALLVPVCLVSRTTSQHETKTTMNTPNFRPALLGAAMLLPATLFAATVVDLEDLNPGATGYRQDWQATGGFTSAGTFFNNTYFSSSDYWAGFALSETTDTTTPGYLNQYSAFTGGGSGPNGEVVTGGNYVVANVDNFTLIPTITLAAGESPLSVRITNATYAALSMKNGDGPGGFAKKFGGVSGNDPDFFKLTITGMDAVGGTTGTVDFYLADYRFADNDQDYIVKNWTEVDLSALGLATQKLAFSLTSSDVGAFGMNTPAYFALDNLVVIPEPGTPLLLAAAGLVGLLRRRR